MARILSVWGELGPFTRRSVGERSESPQGLWRSHAVATKYATTHFFGDYSKPEHNFVVKAVVLCAIPGSTLPEAMWTRAPKGERKHGRGAFQLDVQDDRLDKAKMRLVDSGASREKDWTCQNPAEYSQTISSRAYTIGLAIGVMEALRANHYGQEGAKKKLIIGPDNPTCQLLPI
eukprot:s325_g39.t1